MELRKVDVGHISLVLLLSVQLFCFPVSVLASDPAEAGDAFGTPSADKLANEFSQDFIRTDGGVSIQLEKRMPEQPLGTNVSTAVEVGTPATPMETPKSEPAPVPPAESVPFAEPEDPFKSASPDIPELKDPLVKYNRFMYSVNDHIYEYVMDPIARRYRDWVNEDIRIALRNMFANATSAVKLVSSLVQGDLDKATRVFGRVVINSSIGFGGLFDVADKHFHIDDVNEDFGQALGYHSIPPGPYLVLPFFGPSTVRDTVGRVVDSFLSPSIVYAPGFLAGSGISLTDRINSSSFILEDKKGLDESAVDEYESIRDFYHQYREGLIRK